MYFIVSKVKIAYIVAEVPILYSMLIPHDEANPRFQKSAVGFAQSPGRTRVLTEWIQPINGIRGGKS